MQEESMQIKVKMKAKVEKYADDVTQEEIDAGTAVPYEVVEIDDDVVVTREQAEELGLIKKESE